MAGAVVAGLFLLGWRAAVVTAFSRVYIAAHYPKTWSLAAGGRSGQRSDASWCSTPRLIWLVEVGERTPWRRLFTTAPRSSAPAPPEPIAV
jgi:undecaprenyl-diphosphatase